MWKFTSRRSWYRLKTFLLRHSLTLVIFTVLTLFIGWARSFTVDIFVHGTGKVTADSHYKIVEHLGRWNPYRAARHTRTKSYKKTC